MDGPDIRTLRTNLKLTQQVFATCLGFSLASVNKWERGVGHATGINNTVLWLLSDAIQVSGAETVAVALRESALNRRKMLESLMKLAHT